MVTAGPDGVEERLQLAERTFRLARETGRSSIAQWGHAWRFDALVQLGRIDEAELALADQTRLADKLREPLDRWRAVEARSWLALLHGRFAEAAALAEEARNLGRIGHHVPAEFTYLLHRQVVALHVGGHDEAFLAMVEQFRLHSDTESMSPAVEAAAFVQMGRMEEARTALRRVAAAGLETYGPAAMWLPIRAVLTEAITAGGEADMASAVYKALLPYARLNVSSGGAALVGSVARYLGRRSSAANPWDNATEPFQPPIY